ncbi:transcriptional regulator [Cryobacterium sp. MLB-32]|uniref:response regulator transcription factor n=1 Tax=Cryobacterium sp. MLB-32 TaxID=1529318 RepID=UPI0004E6D9BD|nr:response regulator transcription factor [Cryobacterium sp. MLB-32]KFF59596.1 transcriptional regulator [Cryobacterium sp. MLB-32]
MTDELCVLLIDDDPEIRLSLGTALRLENYRVVTANDGLHGLAQTAREDPAAIIVDVTMPGTDGLSFCRQLRASGDRVPILMLTARAGVNERVAGLDAGADDYLSKPFELAELLARLRALVRRAYATGQDSSVFAGLSIEIATRSGTRAGRRIEFTNTEFALLRFLLEHPGQILTRAQISTAIWESDFGPASNALDVYVSYLRRKLESHGETRLIHTVRGLGYRLAEQ